MIKLYVDPVYTRIYGLSEFHEEVLNDMLAFKPNGYFFTPSYQRYKNYREAKMVLSQNKRFKPKTDKFAAS